MYKVLIVDDEKIIRMGIKNIIPWETMNISEVYTAASGREALELIRLQITTVFVKKGMKAYGLWHSYARLVFK